MFYVLIFGLCSFTFAFAFVFAFVFAVVFAFTFTVVFVINGDGVLLLSTTNAKEHKQKIKPQSRTEQNGT